MADFGSGHLVLTGHGHGTRRKANNSKLLVASVAIGRVGDRDVVVSGGHDGTVRIWDTRSGQQLGEPLGEAEFEMLAVAIERTGDRDVIFAVHSNDLDVWQWDARSRQLVGPALTHDFADTVRRLAIGRVGGRYVIVTGRHDRTVWLREVGSGKPVGPPLPGLTGPFPGPDSVAIGRLVSRSVILAGHQQFVRVYDPGSGEPLFDLWTDHPGVVTAVTCGRLGGRDVVVSGGDDGTLRVWDADSRHGLGQPLTGHTKEVLGVAIGRINNRDVIVSGGADGTVRVWPAP